MSSFSANAHWIWDAGDRRGYNDYLRARRSFKLREVENSQLLITADALYQVFLNGVTVGHGPAKSAAGTRSVDCYDITPFLQKGENLLDVIVLSVGVSTMTYCLGDAGLIFELRLGSEVIGSDGKVRVRREPGRTRCTVRRWVLPCIEDVDAAAGETPWRAANVINGTATLYPRRVPLPTRSPVCPERLVSVGQVELPNFSVSYRLKPALVSREELERHNHFDTEATLCVPIDSPKAQTLRLTYTVGGIRWELDDGTVLAGSGWMLGPETNVPLKAGRNLLKGRHLHNHFDDITLAGFAEYPVTVGGLHVTRDEGGEVEMEPMPFANSHALAHGARSDSKGLVKRTILDLGRVYNGWIAFDVEGVEGQSVMISLFEAMEEGASQRIQWPEVCNNSVMYRLRNGRQHFETFHSYGGRYIIVDELNGPVRWENLRLLKASCAAPRTGHFLSDDPLLNSIYTISAQSLEAGTDDTFTDCPTFEQVNWNFDNRLAAHADSLIFPNREVTRNSIELFAEDPLRTGLVASQTPSAWDLKIPLWAFAWIEWCWDYYWQTGDLAFARRIFPAVRQGIEEALSRVNSRGLMEWPGAWHFVEWSHGRDDDHDINTGEQAGLISALEAATKLARAAGRKWDVSEQRKNLIKAVRRHLWQPDRNAFADSLHADGTPSSVSSRLTNAMMARCGAGTATWSRQLAQDLADDTTALVPIGSPYGIYHLLELLDQHGYRDVIFKQITERWGDMVRAGDGTTWEMFAEFGHGSWPTRSRCHPFSAYVAKYLVKYVLGVQPLEPGFAKVKVAPNPPAFINACHGTVPTPHGPLRISWTRKRSKLLLDVKAPAGIRLANS